MAEFKVGDRVEVVDTDYLGPELQNGALGTVVFASAACCNVAIDGLDWGDNEWAFFPSQIAHTTKQKPATPQPPAATGEGVLVTEDMVTRALDAFTNTRAYHTDADWDRHLMRAALEAALNGGKP